MMPSRKLADKLKMKWMKCSPISTVGPWLRSEMEEERFDLDMISQF